MCRSKINILSQPMNVNWSLRSLFCLSSYQLPSLQNDCSGTIQQEDDESRRQPSFVIHARSDAAYFKDNCIYRKEEDYNFRFNNMDKVLNKIKGYYWVSTQLNWDMLTPASTVLWRAVIFVICVKEKEDRKRRCTNVRFFPKTTKIHVEWEKLFLITLKVGPFQLRTHHFNQRTTSLF